MIIRFPDDYRDRHGIPLVTVPVADVEDADAFPNIAEAVSLKHTDPVRWAELNRLWIDDAREVRRG